MKEKIAGIGALVSASLASICCIGPLALVALGLGGARFAAGLARYRLFFLAWTVLFLGSAFYFTYRKREVACADGTCQFRTGSQAMKTTLWVIAVVAVGLASYPSWAPLLFSCYK
jgi:mercuric ion transport protein